MFNLNQIKLSQDDINSIIENTTGKLDDFQCRMILHWMMGYMRFARDAEDARQAFFNEIKDELEKK